jgi:hypothetical protein
VAAVDVCASFEWAGRALARPYNSTRSESRPSVAGPSSPTAPPPAFAKGLDLRESSEPVRKTARHVKSTLLAVVDMLDRPKAGMEGAARKVARAGRLVELIETHVDRWQLVQQGRRPGSGLHSPSLAVAWETLVCSGRLPVDLVVGNAGRQEADLADLSLPSSSSARDQCRDDDGRRVLRSLPSKLTPLSPLDPRRHLASYRPLQVDRQLAPTAQVSSLRITDRLPLALCCSPMSSRPSGRPASASRGQPPHPRLPKLETGSYTLSGGAIKTEPTSLSVGISPGPANRPMGAKLEPTGSPARVKRERADSPEIVEIPRPGPSGRPTRSVPADAPAPVLGRPPAKKSTGRRKVAKAKVEPSSAGPSASGPVTIDFSHPDVMEALTGSHDPIGKSFNIAQANFEASQAVQGAARSLSLGRADLAAPVS